MNSRDRTILTIAWLLSIGAHVALIKYSLDLPIRSGGGKLFAASFEREDPIPIRILRDNRDRFTQEELQELLRTEDPVQSGAEQIQEAANELLASVDTEAVAPEFESDPLKMIDPGEVRNTPEPLAAEEVQATSAANVDVMQQLLAMSKPEIELPKFTEASTQDPTILPTEAPKSFGEEFDPVAIAGAIGSGVDSGRGLPGGIGIGLGGGSGAGGRGVGTGRSGAVAIPDAPDINLNPAGNTNPNRNIDLPLPEATPIETPQPADQREPIHLDEDFHYRLLTYKETRNRLFGGREQVDEPGYFEVSITPLRSLRRLTPLKKDVLFAIDTSDSITDRWIAQVRSGVSNALDTLNEGDTFNIMLFKDQVSVFRDAESVAATPANITAARAFLQQADASGYTDVNRALGKLIVRTVPPDRVRQIVLLSDGKPTRGAVNARSIINMITRENDQVASIYCVGIGDTLDRELLQYLAYRNKGIVVYPPTLSQLPATIADLASRLRYPIAKDATFSVVGVNGGAIYPQVPRDIYQDEPLSLFGRFQEGADELHMHIRGISGATRLDFTFSLDFKNAVDGTEATMDNWAFWKLHHLYSEAIRRGTNDGDVQDEIRDLKRKYRIRVDY